MSMCSPVKLARQRTNALTNEPRMSKVLVDKRVAAPLVTSCITILLANPWQPDEFSACSSYTLSFSLREKKEREKKKYADTATCWNIVRLSKVCALSRSWERLVIGSWFLSDECRFALPSLFTHCFFRRLVISAATAKASPIGIR